VATTAVVRLPRDQSPGRLRIPDFEESIRVDSSAYFLGLRLSFFVAIVMTAAGLAWFIIVQARDRDRKPRGAHEAIPTSIS
jgi:hypothetical protein